MMIAIILALYACVLLTDFRPLAKACAPGIKALYLSLMAISFAVLTIHELGGKVPSPSKLIEQLVRTLFGVS